MGDHIFISYSHSDASFVDNLLTAQLKKHGFEAWIDAEKLRAGKDWREQLDEGIRTAFALIVVMSPDAKKSDYVTYEWAYAWGVGINVITIFLKKVDLHPRLEALQYLDFTDHFNLPWKDLIKQLKDLKTTSEQIALSAPPLTSAIEPHINALKSRDSSKRLDAVKTLGTIGDKSVAKHLADLLSHDQDQAVRIAAAIALGNIASADIPHSLIGAMNSEQSAQVRKAIAQALGELGTREEDKDVVQSIISCLMEKAHDKSIKVQRACIEALGEISRGHLPGHATIALIDLLDEGILDKSSLIEELRQSPSPKAIGAVKEWDSNQQNQQ